jgi:hypothetical protein
MRSFIFLLLLAAVASVASGQAYKWRDASGRIQYSDTPPPPGAKDVQQLRKSAPASSASTPGATGSATAKSVTDQDAEFRKRQVEKQEADAKQAKAAEEAELNARNCATAKGQLAAVETGGRLVRLNERGERITLEDSERERAKQEAVKAVETWCK